MPFGIRPGVDGDPGVGRRCNCDADDNRAGWIRDPARDHSLVLLGGQSARQQQDAGGGDRGQRPTLRMTAWYAGSDAMVLNGA